MAEENASRLTSMQSAETNAPFMFDRVFDMSSRQQDIFDFSIRSTVEDVMNGYNGTVFAYGQTGAGKSYTMMGDMDDSVTKGIIPRITEQIFDAILVHGSAQVEYTVGISYMEIYMERIRDLLNPMMDNLPIHESAKGPYVKGLTEIYVNQVEEVYTAMHLGQRSRATVSTTMNVESSRSHSIFMVTINQKDVNSGSLKSGTLYLVDLAGSEKVGKTGATGQTLEEAKKINKSLSALGMVINALTDSKSTHIPYRDSKLTRILQESLGGNSRTTLIVNCSPSSYNEAETISTLRFGIRAKTIKNKAKINAELSPAELKRQLKIAQTQAMTFEKYIASLDSELQLWRKGETVPKEKWVPPLSSTMVTGRGEQPRPPETPSRLPLDSLRPETPSRPDSRAADRSSTPSLIIEKDEREEFLRRENELNDQLAEKETQAANAERSLQEVRDELRSLKESAMRQNKENEVLAEKLNKSQLELQKLSFQSREDGITMDSLKEANSELEVELVSVKQQLLDLKMNAKETSAILDEKDRKKQEKMVRMLAGFDLGNNTLSESERKWQDLLNQVDALREMTSGGHVVAADDLVDLRCRIVESHALIHQAEKGTNDGGELSEINDKGRSTVELRLAAVEREYEALLVRNLGPADVEEAKQKLITLYSGQKEFQVSELDDVREQLRHQTEEVSRLQRTISENKGSQINGVSPITNGVTSKTLQQQIADFDAMKKSLMRDLQNRCERVVELEISLDETREQYNNVLRSSNSRQQQKKMAFLERNLEQLTVVQRQLVEQNTSLKKEVAIAERKLTARNERIISLENLLADSQDKLTAANHRYVSGTWLRADNILIHSIRFEAQLQAVKERLEAAKMSSRNTAAAASGQGGFITSVGARIAKPLRGGGGADGSVLSNGMPSLPILSSLQNSEGSPASGKRTSWFFNSR